MIKPRNVTVPDDSEIDSLAIAHLADMITAVTGHDDNDAVATQAANLFRSSLPIQYAALCYGATALTDAEFRAIVAGAVAQ
jgi:hypothetical protein